MSDNEDFPDAPPSEFYVSTDDTYLDRNWVATSLLGTYWGSWRTFDIIQKSLDTSLNFGLYQRKEFGTRRQVGFARVVGDGVTFSWICDVYLDPEYRKQGLGKFLMDIVVTHPAVCRTVQLLRTKDQQAFYKKLSFTEVDAMRRLPK
jgi:GNAT superfamily N-acetyltransferase